MQQRYIVRCKKVTFMNDTTTQKNFSRNLSYLSMLRHFCLFVPRIILPPKSRLFWGVAVLRYFHQFLSLGDKKNFGKNLGQLGTFEIFFGQISAIFCTKTTIEISKIPDFGVIFAQI